MFVIGDRVTHLKTKVVMFVEGVSRAGDFYKCRYRHNGSWSYDTFPEEELMLEHREPVIALACLNQHPEHQWEDSGFYLAQANQHGYPGSEKVGPAVEVCSRPGCGLIRVRQEKRQTQNKPDLGWDNAFGKIEEDDQKPLKNTVESVSGQVRCERCQCLTPVSELSSDAQGRMVCKHH